MPHSAQNLRLGIDLGGTKTEIIALDASGLALDRWRISSPVGNYAATLSMLCELVAETEKRLGPVGRVGIGIPGAISPQTGLVKNSNSTWLTNHPLQADLENLLNRPVATSNDANCLALSEATDGAGKDAKVVWGLIIGTGVGSGIVIDGKVLTGTNSIGGEWGHNPMPNMPPEPPTCYCGHKGCVETFLSGPALVTDHHKHGGKERSPQDIQAAARSGNHTAQTTLNRYADRLAQATAMVINILDPEVIVIGGGIGNMAYLYDAVPALWPKYVFSDTVLTRLRPPAHGDSSGVRGAAWL